MDNFGLSCHMSHSVIPKIDLHFLHLLTRTRYCKILACKFGYYHDLQFQRSEKYMAMELLYLLLRKLQEILVGFCAVFGIVK